MICDLYLEVLFQEGISLTSDNLPVTNTSRTKRAREIYDNGRQMHRLGHRLCVGTLDNQVVVPCLYLCITEWSDAFQPSSSIKARKSVWVKTVTISARALTRYPFIHCCCCRRGA